MNKKMENQEAYHHHLHHHRHDHGDDENWTEAVENLVHEGEIDKAITLLEAIVENHKNKNSLQLATALLDLSKLYSIKGLSLKADDASNRALLIKQHLSHSHKGDSNTKKEVACDQVLEDDVSHNEPLARGEKPEAGVRGNSSGLQTEDFARDDSLCDDWEAIADRASEELLSPQSFSGMSKLSIEDSPKVQSSKRRGRGTFSYRAQGLYSDQQSDGPTSGDSQDDSVCQTSEENNQIGSVKYGTRHVLVLADFPPSTKTTDLEKLLEDFKDRGVVIRWVNDTTALAVFRSPSHALEASNSIRCSFTVRMLDEDDTLLSSIPPRDLEPPRPRPKTSARTAQRLIAQGMGIKLPSTSSGSRELRKQEEAARRNRIVSRQHMRDDAWGDDLN